MTASHQEAFTQDQNDPRVLIANSDGGKLVAKICTMLGIAFEHNKPNISEDHRTISMTCITETGASVLMKILNVLATPV